MSEERTTGPTTVALAYLHTVYCSSYIALCIGQPAVCRMRIGNRNLFRRCLRVPVSVSGWLRTCQRRVRLRRHPIGPLALRPPSASVQQRARYDVAHRPNQLRRRVHVVGRRSALARARGQSARARAQSSARTPSAFAITGAKTRQRVDALCRRSQRFSAASATTPACHRDAAATAPLLCLTPTCSCGRLIESVCVRFRRPGFSAGLGRLGDSRRNVERRIRVASCVAGVAEWLERVTHTT